MPGCESLMSIRELTNLAVTATSAKKTTQKVWINDSIVSQQTDSKIIHILSSPSG